MNTEGRAWLALMMNHPYASRWGHYFVAAAWINGTRVSNASGSLTTDGQSLFSYGHEVGYTEGDLKVLRDCHYSVTTAKHIHAARVAADKIVPCTHP